MDKKFIYENMLNILDENKIKIDEPMKMHTSFKVGGPADVLVKPDSEDEIKKILEFVISNNIPYMVIGNGSNLLVKDGGIRGVVIEISNNFNSCIIEGNIVKVQAGALLSIVGRNALNNNLKGFEFAAGIPGTIGGALTMNAGAYGGEMRHIVKSVKVLTKNGKILTLSNEEMEFAYRSSIIGKEGYIALSCEIELEKGEYDEIKAVMSDLANRRITKQPLNLPSAGSTFKRPEGYFAGKLIEDCGMRGLMLRGAQVSEKHCGFVVNSGGATAKDLLDLMFIIKSTVKAKFNIKLEEEVKIIGED